MYVTCSAPYTDEVSGFLYCLRIHIYALYVHVKFYDSGIYVAFEGHIFLAHTWQIALEVDVGVTNLGYICTRQENIVMYPLWKPYLFSGIGQYRNVVYKVYRILLII